MPGLLTTCQFRHRLRLGNNSLYRLTLLATGQKTITHPAPGHSKNAYSTVGPLPRPYSTGPGRNGPPASSHNRARHAIVRFFCDCASLPTKHNHAFWSHPDCASHRMVLSLLVPFAIIDLPNRRDPEVRIVANPPASSVCAHLRLRVRRNHKRAHCQLRPKAFSSEPSINLFTRQNISP